MGQPLSAPMFANNSQPINTTGCKDISTPKNSIFGLHLGGFENLVEVIIINSVIAIIVMSIFSMLVKRARKLNIETEDVGKISWIDLFYGNLKDAVVEADPIMPNTEKPNKFVFWLWSAIKLTEEQIIQRSGNDAIKYLMFQKRIIVLVLIITVINLCVVLPVNYLGFLEPTRVPFARTSLRNVDPKSLNHWIHVIISFLYLLVGIVLFKSFFLDPDTSCNELYHALLIRNISQPNKQEVIQKYFEAMHPTALIANIHLIYDVKKLLSLNQYRIATDNAIEWCNQYIEEKNERPMLRVKCCGYAVDTCYCCCFCQKVDALDFYQAHKLEISSKIPESKETALANPLDMAFVVFDTHEMAENVLEEFETRKSAVNKDFNFVKDWKILIAPVPGDILWENLGVKKRNWYLMLFVSHVCMLLIIIFLSTPNVFMSLLGKFKISYFIGISAPFLSQYMSTLFMILFASLLPVFITLTASLLPFFTRSEYTSTVNKRLLTFLLLMVVILPVCQFTSVEAIIRKTSEHSDEQFRWECIFLPDDGLFFMTYLLQSGMIGVTMQLMHFSDIVMYFLRLLFAWSKAEIVTIRKRIVNEFDYGYHYSYFLLHTSIIISFSVATPFIAPCGLVYLTNKYWVDRYNIHFSYLATTVSPEVHQTAVALTFLGYALHMAFMSVITYVREDMNFAFALYIAGLIFTTLLLFFMLQKKRVMAFLRKNFDWKRKGNSGNSGGDHVSRSSFQTEAAFNLNEQYTPVELEMCDLKEK